MHKIRSIYIDKTFPVSVVYNSIMDLNRNNEYDLKVQTFSYKVSVSSMGECCWYFSTFFLYVNPTF